MLTNFSEQMGRPLLAVRSWQAKCSHAILEGDGFVKDGVEGKEMKERLEK